MTIFTTETINTVKICIALNLNSNHSTKIWIITDKWSLILLFFIIDLFQKYFLKLLLEIKINLLPRLWLLPSRARSNLKGFQRGICLSHLTCDRLLGLNTICKRTKDIKKKEFFVNLYKILVKVWLCSNYFPFLSDIIPEQGQLLFLFI